MPLDLYELDVDTYALLYNNSLNKNSVLNDLASSQSLSASDAINALIKDKAIEQEAQNEGIQVTDAEAKEQLNNMESLIQNLIKTGTPEEQENAQQTWRLILTIYKDLV